MEIGLNERTESAMPKAASNAGKRILRLPHHVIDMIKAGEVIERPASVVKELFENAVDAGATDVQVELLDGGRALIRVTDSGCGIAPEDVVLALERHATSKLEKPEDLLGMGTFGFRGEALASIAAVGRLSLRSRTESENLAVEIEVAEGKRSEPRRIAAPVGTSVTLRDLFSSVPARQKFLKSTATEFSHVQDYLLAMCVAYPRVGVRLAHNGRDVFRYGPSANLEARFEAMQRELAREFVRFSYARGGLCIEGFAGLPESARPVPRLFLTFVNGRLVKDRVVRSGVLEAYSGLVLKGLLPSAVVFVSIDPAQVDVNAHPAKTEVRFQDVLAVEDAVTMAVQNALKEHVSKRMMLPAEPMAGARQEPVRAPSQVSASPFPSTERNVSSTSSAGAFGGASAGAFGSRAAPAYQALRSLVAPSPLAGSAVPNARSAHQAPLARPPTLFEKPADAALLASSKHDITLAGPFAGARYLGQYLDCYLLFQAEADLLVVDQHAFHERVLYEELTRTLDAGNPPQQELLTPVLVPVPARVAGLVAEKSEALAKLGFRAEALSDGSGLAVHAFPAFLVPGRVAEVFEEVIARIVALSDLPEAEVHPFLLRAKSVREEFAGLAVHERSLEARSVFHMLHATMACHAAVRAGDPLSEELVRRLVNRSADVDFFAHCPHGRPVYRRLTRKDVAEWFLRI